MNPLIHAEASWLLGRGLNARRDRVLVAVAGVSPDVDGLSLLFGEAAYGQWHHVLTHGLASALVFSLLLAAFSRQRRQVFGLAFLAFHLHLLCDFVGSGPGWPLVYGWPFSHVEWLWSGQWNLASWQNALFGLVITLWALSSAKTFGRTQFELISLRLDAEVVKTVRARF